MAEAEGQLDPRGALGGGAVPDTDDLEVLGEAVGDADNHVVDQRAGEPVQGAVLALVVGPLDQQLRTVLAHGDVGRHAAEEGPLGTLHRDLVAGDTDVDTRRDRDGGFTDTRHSSS